MSTFDPLRRFLSEKATFTEDDFVFMTALFQPRTLRAGEFFQRAGEVATHAAFVARGCLRSYVVDAKGNEHIVQFAPENWWLSDATSISTGTASRFFYDAVEETDLLTIDYPSHQKIVDNVPAFSTTFRNGLQRHAAAKDVRIVNALSNTAEERYLEFMKTYPSIALRVPQWMLASYLGVSPETLSRIRKALSRK